MNKKQLQKITESIAINGGATLDANFNFCAFDGGFMVSLQGYEKQIKKISIKDLKQYQKIALKNNAFIGLRVDGGVIYLDISIKIDHKLQAIREGIKNNQKAIFDLNNNCSIYL